MKYFFNVHFCWSHLINVCSCCCYIDIVLTCCLDWSAHPLPLTSERYLSDLNAEERRAIYYYCVATGKATNKMITFPKEQLMLLEDQDDKTGSTLLHIINLRIVSKAGLFTHVDNPMSVVFWQYSLAKGNIYLNTPIPMLANRIWPCYFVSKLNLCNICWPSPPSDTVV